MYIYIYVYTFVLALSDRMTLLFPGGQGKLHLAFLWQQYSASAKTQLLGWFRCYEIVHGGSSHDLEVVENHHSDRKSFQMAFLWLI